MTGMTGPVGLLVQQVEKHAAGTWRTPMKDGIVVLPTADGVRAPKIASFHQRAQREMLPGSKAIVSRKLDGSSNETNDGILRILAMSAFSIHESPCSSLAAIDSSNRLSIQTARDTTQRQSALHAVEPKLDSISVSARAARGQRDYGPSIASARNATGPLA